VPTSSLAALRRGAGDGGGAAPGWSPLLGGLEERGGENSDGVAATANAVGSATPPSSGELLERAAAGLSCSALSLSLCMQAGVPNASQTQPPRGIPPSRQTNIEPSCAHRGSSPNSPPSRRAPPPSPARSPAAPHAVARRTRAPRTRTAGLPSSGDRPVAGAGKDVCV